MFTGKVELGQGILTALAQIAAEELDLPIARLKMISGDTGQTPNEGMTAGSQSIENSGTRAAAWPAQRCASILIDLAAKKLGVGADTLKVADGTISTADGRKVTYGELASEVDLKREATAKVAPKPPARHKIVGKSVAAARHSGQGHRRRQLCAGHAAAGHGARPRRAAAARRADARSPSTRRGAKTLPGVIAVVRDGSFLGVVAEREEQAIKAREALIKSAKWKLGPRTARSRRRSIAHLKTLPSKDQVIGVKQAPALASATHARGDLHQALPGARLDRPVRRARASCATAD